MAQKLSLGAIGGFHLNDDFRSRPDLSGQMTNPPTSFFAFRKSSSFTPRIGPKIEIDFTRRWSLETDVLFHRAVWTTTVRYDPPIAVRPGGPLVAEQVDRIEESIVEIPVLLKHRIGLGGARLVLEAGPTVLPFGGFESARGVGLTTGVGTEFLLGPVRLQPTVRYSRWPKSPDERDGGGFLHFRRDMVSLLLGADIPRTSLGTADPWTLFSVGFVGGTTLTNDFPERNGFEGVTSRMAGVAFEHQWADRWSVEADVLYHPLVLSERARATVLTWEAPVLVKRRFHLGPVRPILLAGPTFRLSGNRNSSSPSPIGVAAGGGIEFRRGRLSLTPTLRYVRWKQDALIELSPGRIRQDQVQALVTIGFGGR